MSTDDHLGAPSLEIGTKPKWLALSPLVLGIASCIFPFERYADNGTLFATNAVRITPHSKGLGLAMLVVLGASVWRASTRKYQSRVTALDATLLAGAAAALLGSAVPMFAGISRSGQGFDVGLTALWVALATAFLTLWRATESHVWPVTRTSFALVAFILATTLAAYAYNQSSRDIRAFNPFTYQYMTCGETLAELAPPQATPETANELQGLCDRAGQRGALRVFIGAVAAVVFAFIGALTAIRKRPSAAP